MMHRIGLSRTLCPWRTHTQLLPPVSYIRSFIQASCKAQNQLSDLCEDEAVERPVKRKAKAQNVSNNIEEPTLEEKEQSIDKLHADALKSGSYPHASESMSSELQTIPASALSSDTVSAQDYMPVMEADDQEGMPSSTNDDMTAMIPTQDYSAPTARATGPSVSSHRFKGCSYCDSSDHRLQQCPLRPSVSTLDRSPVSESPEQPFVPSASYATNYTSQQDLLEMNQRSLRLRGVVSVRRGLRQPFRQAAPSLVAGEHSSAARNGDAATWGGRVALQSVPWAGAYAGQSSSWAPRAPAGSAVQLELEAQTPSSFQPGPLTASSATNATSQSQVCFKCGEPGHWASNCTKSYYNMRRQPFRRPAVSQLKQPTELHLSSLSPLGLPMLLEEPGEIQEKPSSSMLTAQDGSAECYVHSVHDDSALQCSTTALCEVSAGSGSSASLRQSAVNVLTTAAVRTMVAVDQRSSTWLLARGDRLTASSFLMVTGISPYSNGRGCSRHDFFYEKVGIVKKLPNIAMLNGQRKEPIALQEYCLSAGGAQVASCGFVAYEPLGTWAYPADVMSDETTSLSNDLMQNNLLSSRAWLGGSPDGLVLTSEGAQALLQAVADSASAVTPGGALNEDKRHSQIVSPGRVSSAILQGSGVLEIKCPFYSGAVDNVDKNYKYLFQIQGLMEMLNVEWADLFVYSDMGGEKKALKVRIKRDRAFWAALIPHLWEFWFHHVIPARQAVQKHMLSLEQGGQSSSLSKGAVLVVNAKGCWETGEADHCLDDVESEDETGSAGSPSNINSLSENEIALNEVAQKKLKMRENKEATDILKAVVREYLPSAELPNNATRNLDAWAREMYSSAEIHAL